MNKIRAGFAFCGSFCTFSMVVEQLEVLKTDGIEIIPIMSQTSYTTDTRFGKCADFIKEIEDITQNKILHTVKDCEPIGPKKTLDILIIEPCTGNTLAKLANGIADTSVTMAAKAHLRNERPVLIAISTNDGLSGAAKNIGLLHNAKNVYFVPYRQDDPLNKPCSLVADFNRTLLSVHLALDGKQLQPVLL